MAQGKGVILSLEQRNLLDRLKPLLGTERHEIDALWRLDYRTQPPSVEAFLEDDYYLGSSLRRTVNNEGLWPSWRDWFVAFLTASFATLRPLCEKSRRSKGLTQRSPRAQRNMYDPQHSSDSYR
jgi:hypothetical protein